MNFLFTFDTWINTYVLIEFESFVIDLGITPYTMSANSEFLMDEDDDEDDIQFPPNFIVTYVDTEDEELIKTISNKYHRLLEENPEGFIKTENNLPKTFLQ